MKTPISFLLAALALFICTPQSFVMCAPTEFQLSKDGVGPVVVNVEVTINGREAQLKASARNDSGQPIRHAKFCVSAEQRTKGCDFQIWTTRTWKTGEELNWAPLKGPARKGIDNVRVTIMEFDVSPTEVANGDSSKFTVYISAPKRDGSFDTSKDIQDSIKDISNRLRDAREIEIVSSTEKADVILTVVARGIGPKAFRERTSVYGSYFLNTVESAAVPILENTYWVSTVMEVGSYKKEFSVGYPNTVRTPIGAWTRDANDIADDLIVWIAANVIQLKDRRKTK
jgi:hypothetical protein